MDETLPDVKVEFKQGRWTSDEHELFIQGLKTYGKDWENIQSLVKTRSVIQIRSHS